MESRVPQRRSAARVDARIVGRRGIAGASGARAASLESAAFAASVHLFLAERGDVRALPRCGLRRVPAVRFARRRARGPRRAVAARARILEGGRVARTRVRRARAGRAHRHAQRNSRRTLGTKLVDRQRLYSRGVRGVRCGGRRGRGGRHPIDEAGRARGGDLGDGGHALRPGLGASAEQRRARVTARAVSKRSADTRRGIHVARGRTRAAPRMDRNALAGSRRAAHYRAARADARAPLAHRALGGLAPALGRANERAFAARLCGRRTGGWRRDAGRPVRARGRRVRGRRIPRSGAALRTRAGGIRRSGAVRAAPRQEPRRGDAHRARRRRVGDGRLGDHSAARGASHAPRHARRRGCARARNRPEGIGRIDAIGRPGDGACSTAEWNASSMPRPTRPSVRPRARPRAPGDEAGIPAPAARRCV